MSNHPQKSGSLCSGMSGSLYPGIGGSLYPGILNKNPEIIKPTKYNVLYRCGRGELHSPSHETGSFPYLQIKLFPPFKIQAHSHHN
jgi:hypothetical protein